MSFTQAYSLSLSLSPPPSLPPPSLSPSLPLSLSLPSHPFPLSSLSQIINALLESERRYISGLSLLHTQFEEPLKMLALYKPDVLSLHQLNCLFLNW